MTIGYEQLDTQLDKVIEAAINAAMREEGFREGSCAEGEFRNTVNLVLDPEVGGEFNPVDFILTYPAGEWLVTDGYNRVPFSQTGWAHSGYQPPFIGVGLFNMMRGAIHGAFANWSGLPDPDGFATPIGTLGSVAASLNVGGPFVDGEGAEAEIDGDGNIELDIHVNYVDDELAQYNGHMIDTFDANYASRLRPTITGQYVVTCVLGTLMTGEQKIWDATRQDVIALAVNAEAGFNDLANRRGSVSLKQLLKVAGVASSVAGLFLSGTPAGPAIGVAGKVVGIISSLTPETPKHVEVGLSGGSVDEVLATLRDSLDAINKTLAAEEEALHWCGFKAGGVIRKNPGQFDIARPGEFLEDNSGEYFKDGENLKVLIPHLREIAARFSMIGGIQHAAAGQLDSTIGESRWSRWSSLGWSPNGHYNAYADLYSELDLVLTSSAKELKEVAGRLVQVSHDFQATEDQVEAELLQLTQQVRSGLPQD